MSWNMWGTVGKEFRNVTYPCAVESMVIYWQGLGKHIFYTDWWHYAKGHYNWKKENKHRGVVSKFIWLRKWCHREVKKTNSCKLQWENETAWAAALVRTGWKAQFYRGVVYGVWKWRSVLQFECNLYKPRKLLRGWICQKSFSLYHGKVFWERTNLGEIIYEKLRKRCVVVLQEWTSAIMAETGICFPASLSLVSNLWISS